MREFLGGCTLRQIDNIYYSLSLRPARRPRPDELDDATVRRLGMWSLACTTSAPAGRLSTASAWMRTPTSATTLHDTLPKHLRDRYLDAALAIADILDKQLASVPVHRIHGDLHLGNLLLRDGLLHVLDFDDMAIGPAVQDLWLAPTRFMICGSRTRMGP